MSGDITTKDRGCVYVLTRHQGGRDTKEYKRPATTALLEDHYDILPTEVQEKFDALRGTKARRDQDRSVWANLFLDALDSGEQFLPRQGNGFKVLRDADPSLMNTREIVLRALWHAGERGMTVAEIKRASGVASDGVSGALSELSASRILVRLAERR